MTKIYMMEIRDLTNEAKELNAQAIEIKAFEEEVQRKMKIMAENHISAIASYLNHQLDEVVKFTTSFRAGIYENEERIVVKIEKRGNDIVYLISIKPFYHNNFTNFIISSNCKYYDALLSDINKKSPAYAETLIKNWSKLKKQLLYNIKTRIEEIQRANEIEQAQLREKLALYENFEL